MCQTIENKYKLLYLIPVFLFVIGFIAATIAAHQIVDDIHIEFDKDFNNTVNELSILISDEVEKNLDFTISLGELFEIHPNTTRSQFALFTQNSLNRSLILAVTWIPRIYNETRHELELNLQQEYNDSRITIRQIGTDSGVFKSDYKSVYYPVVYVEPIELNYPFLLLDVSSQTERNRALQKALTNHQISVTKILKLVGTQLGFLAFYPVYYQKKSEQFIGFATNVYVFQQMIQSVLDKQPNYPVKLTVFDDEDSEFLKSFSYNSTNQKWSNSDTNFSSDQLKKIRKIKIGDRKWRILFYHTEKPIVDIPIVVGSIIILISILLAILIIIIIKTLTTRVEKRIIQKEINIKNQFVSYIFHEIRVPLNAMVIGVENLKKSKLARKIRKTINIISSSLDQTTHILNDILDLNKIESGKFTLRKNCLPIQKLTDQVMETFKDSAKAKEIHFTKEVDPLLTTKKIFVDNTRITQCLNNLLSNAFKHTDSGGTVKLKIKLDKTIKTNVSKEDSHDKELMINHQAGSRRDSLFPSRRCSNQTGINMVQLSFSVTDTGCGISHDNLDKLFKPYVQVNNHKSSEIGTGLGLVITKQIVNLHRGEISVKTEIDQGSDFFFTIQTLMSDYECNQPTSRTQSSQTQHQDLNILIVDDNKSNCIVMSEYLAHKKIKNQYVLNGKQAVDLLQQNPNNLFDIILMDKHMPVMDGIEATRQIREFNPQVKILALTGLSSETEKQALIDAGIDDIYIKPFEFQRFEDYLDTTFPKSHLLSPD